MPRYKITSIRHAQPEEGRTYILDPNVWLMIARPPADLRENEREYVDFFDSLVNLASNEKCKTPPRIFVNGMIISEVFNAFVKTSFRAFYATDQIDRRWKSYRRTPDYSRNVDSLRSDFTTYSEYFAGPLASEVTPMEVLTSMPMHCDYNDYYYYRIARENNFIIVTNDGDFRFEEVEIVTNHKQLLALKA